MISMSPNTLEKRAKDWADRIGYGEVLESRSTVGGGSLPEETLPTWALAFAVDKPNIIAKRLRQESPPVITRIEDDRIILDPRTVLLEQDDALVDILAKHTKQPR
jgi:L-seryl-tRNA(Ser) seleniumtransferase